MQSLIFSGLSLGITITCTTFFDMDCKNFMLVLDSNCVEMCSILSSVLRLAFVSAAAECFEHVEL